MLPPIVAAEHVIGFHFLRADWRTQYGDESPWTVGEERTIAQLSSTPVRLNSFGYHYATNWRAAVEHAPGPIACVVDVDRTLVDVSYLTGQAFPRQVATIDDVGVSARRKLVSACNRSEELRLYAVDCAERALRAASEYRRIYAYGRYVTVLERARDVARNNNVANLRKLLSAVITCDNLRGRNRAPTHVVSAIQACAYANPGVAARDAQYWSLRCYPDERAHNVELCRQSDWLYSHLTPANLRTGEDNVPLA